MCNSSTFVDYSLDKRQHKLNPCLLGIFSALLGLFLFLISMVLPNSTAAIALGCSLAGAGLLFWFCISIREDDCGGDCGVPIMIWTSGLMTCVALICIGFQHIFQAEYYGQRISSMAETSTTPLTKTTFFFKTTTGEVVGSLPYWKTTAGSLPSIGTPFTRVFVVPVVDNAVAFLRNRQSVVVHTWMVNFQGGPSMSDTSAFQYQRYFYALNLLNYNKTAIRVDSAAEPVDLYQKAIIEAAAFHNIRLPENPSQSLVLIHASTVYSQYSYYMVMFMGSGIAYLIMMAMTVSCMIGCRPTDGWGQSIMWMFPCCCGENAWCRRHHEDDDDVNTGHNQNQHHGNHASPTVEMAHSTPSGTLPPVVRRSIGPGDLRVNPIFSPGSDDEDDVVRVDATDQVFNSHSHQSGVIRVVAPPPPSFDAPPVSSSSSIAMPSTYSIPPPRFDGPGASTEYTSKSYL